MRIKRKIIKCIWAMNSLIQIVIYKIKYNKYVTIYPFQHFQIGSTIFTEDAGEIKIDRFCHIKKGSEINAYAGGILEIGEHVCINRGVYIAARKFVSIGSKCEIGPNVVIVDHDHDFNAIGGISAGIYKEQSTIIGENVWIGANAVILKGSQIGNNCVIAAGSVVSGKVPENTLYIQKKQTVLKKIGK